MTKPHHNLKVWLKSRNFVKQIYQITTVLPDEEKFGLTSQMRRAAISIPSNIAEGAGRNSRRLLIFWEFARAVLLNLKLKYLSARISGIFKMTPFNQS
jgi:four helix bundle protein